MLLHLKQYRGKAKLCLAFSLHLCFGVTQTVCQCLSCMRLGKAVYTGQAMSRWTTVLAQVAPAEWDYCIKCDTCESLPAAVPRQYQPDIIMLLPKLLEPADHATAANLLIAHLAEATRLGAAAEALIRLPVLATLGLLTVDTGTAKKLLTAILNVSCCLCLKFTCWLFNPLSFAIV